MVDGSTPGRHSQGGGEPPAGPPSGPLNAATPPDPPPPPRSGHRTLLLALVGGIVLVLGVLGVLAGTGAFESRARGGGDATESPGPAVPQAATPTPSGRSPGTTAPVPDASAGVHAFGETQRYGDGVEVSVSAPVRFTPSEVSAGHKAGATAVIVEVAVRNGTDARIELVTVQVSARDGDGREAKRVFDPESDVMSGLSGALLPGRKAVAAYGFDLPAGKAAVLDVEVRVGFDRPSAFWFGKLP
ncbi:DUF4352 domain-containing protein [Streptomyces sp. NBC_00094]|uniref:DUF4352 domain-containing protein n=1 Tax=Streptomyces sp. NBC_00094 TaxID=2903620 RepID=UPI0022562100|nr:DUF4352 domain-containing protein [Streptomyces sp. NBC_00094]MCX5394233.1 DUF4352 domain-containing protein [Streptomyces sp. NBC_00094]